MTRVSLLFVLLLVSSRAWAQSPSPREPALLATVNEVRVTTGDLPPAARRRIDELRAAAERAFERELEMRIDSAVLRAEAARRRVAVVTLLDDEVVAPVEEPTEEEILAVYQRDRRYSAMPPDQARERIALDLRAAQEQARARALTASLRREHEVVVDREAIDSSDPHAVVARVGDERILFDQVDAIASVARYRIEQEIHALVSTQLDVLVNDVLLQQEAGRRKITTQSLLSEAVEARIVRPTEASARTFFDENRERFAGDYASVASEIRAHLEQQSRMRAQLAFARELRAKARIERFLEPPGELVLRFSEEGQPSVGSPDAPVVVTEFRDYACERCREVHAMLRDLQREFGADRVRIVARDLPLRQHPEAVRAAEAAEAAHALGVFEEYTALLFEKPQGLTEAALLRYAEEVGIDRGEFLDLLELPAHRDAVLQDLEECARIGLASTPTVFVNGRIVEEKTPEILCARILEALESARGPAREGAVAETAGAPEGSCCAESIEEATTSAAAATVPSPSGSVATGERIEIPNTWVVDQDGRELRFHDDLVRGRTVAINFFFTTCRTICPPLTANFRQVQRRLEDRMGRDIALVSVSVDPTADRPARLREFADLFQAGPGWSFLTGNKLEVDGLLQRLGGYSEDKTEHTPMVLVYNDRTEAWTRVHGLADATVIADAVREVAGAPCEPAAEGEAAPELPATSGAAAEYFSNTVLRTHEGRDVRFHDDLLAGKTVAIHVMFTTCTGVCPPMTRNLVEVKRYLDGRVGQDIRFLSLTVDPETDTVDRMCEFAEAYGTGGGWELLTGSRENLDRVLGRLGLRPPDKSAHSNLVLVGNLRTAVWTRMLALLDPETLADEIRAIADGAPAGGE